jgi:hypothetical protein
LAPAPPVDGLVDSASTYEVVTACDIGASKALYPWAFLTINEVTLSLIFAGHVRMAPSPHDNQGSAGSLYGRLISELLATNILDLGERPVGTQRARALAKLRRYLVTPSPPTGRTGALMIRHAIDRHQADERNFRPWLEWVVARAWPENIARMGGLVTMEFVPDIASILSVPQAAIQKVADDSSKASLVKSLEGEELELLKRAFLTAALLRGKYHDLLAKEAHRQLLRHPIRADSRPPSSVFAGLEVQHYFTGGLIADAMKHRKADDRISAWVAKVQRARALARAGNLNLFPPQPAGSQLTQDQALSVAVNELMRHGLAGPSSRIDRFIDLGASLGINVGLWALGVPAVVDIPSVVPTTAVLAMAHSGDPC